MNDDAGPDAQGPEAPPLPEIWVQMARSTYRNPGETPREEIWRELEARLFDGPAETPAAPRRPGRPSRRWWPLAAAASVALLLGLGVGRWTVRPSPPGVETTAAVPAPDAPMGRTTPHSRSQSAVRFATARHLTDAEGLLAFVAADAREGRTDPDVGRWGQDLLTRTRLLLDSPVTEDAAVRAVLEDLEIFLAQIALLADPTVDADRVREELGMIARGMEDAGMQGRIRAVLPSVDRRLSAADD